MNAPPVLGAPARHIVATAIADVARHRGWDLLVCHVRTQHVHALLASSEPPEKALATLKAWSTRRLREAGLFGPNDHIWTDHGSTRYVWDERGMEDVYAYVRHAQGEDSGGAISASPLPP
jgi:REP element-mobilizing transposase RayT